ncbi:MAG TPA: response regulator transcription factor, partial [Polyangiaceae bacterium]|nr:response regulator transcription factor [Polyangiaceae bacterium]
MNILLADDHAVVRRGIRELLSEQYPQAEFTEAANGRDALVQSRAREWDLIVLDISMPEKTGLEALA